MAIYVGNKMMGVTEWIWAGIGTAIPLFLVPLSQDKRPVFHFCLFRFAF